MKYKKCTESEAFDALERGKIAHSESDEGWYPIKLRGRFLCWNDFGKQFVLTIHNRKYRIAIPEQKWQETYAEMQRDGVEFIRTQSGNNGHWNFDGDKEDYTPLPITLGTKINKWLEWFDEYSLDHLPIWEKFDSYIGDKISTFLADTTLDGFKSVKFRYKGFPTSEVTLELEEDVSTPAMVKAYVDSLNLTVDEPSWVINPEFLAAIVNRCSERDGEYFTMEEVECVLLSLEGVRSGE